MHLLDHNNKGKAVVLTAAEIELLLEAAKDTRQRIAFSLGALHGLDLRDIDLEDASLRIRHRLDTDTPLKNGSATEWVIAFSPELTEVI